MSLPHPLQQTQPNLLSTFESDREKKCLARYEFISPDPSTPQFARDQMFIAVGEYVYALKLPP